MAKRWPGSEAAGVRQVSSNCGVGTTGRHPHSPSPCSPDSSAPRAHTQQRLLKGLIHYVVNWLQPTPLALAASGPPSQGSPTPRQHLPPTRPHQNCQTTQGQGHQRRGGFRAGTSGVRLANRSRAGNLRVMQKGSQSCWQRGAIGRHPSVTPRTFNSHHSRPTAGTRDQQKHQWGEEEESAQSLQL